MSFTVHPLSRRIFIGGMACATAAAFSPIPARAASALVRFKPKGQGTFNHTAFDGMLRRFVKPDEQNYNRVDYRAFKQSGHGALKAYLSALQTASPTSLSRDEAHAYWVNAYNAKTLDIVLDHYPVSSIKKINLGGGGLFSSGPWSAATLRVEGTDLSLDDVEHRIVRPLFADPLSHYALNCASYSCPNLATSAYTGRNFKTQASDGARAYVNHKRGIDIEGATLTASRIYYWYAADFGGTGKLKSHWEKFASPARAALIEPARIAGYDYDWSLNDL